MDLPLHMLRFTVNIYILWIRENSKAKLGLETSFLMFSVVWKNTELSFLLVQQLLTGHSVSSEHIWL